MIKKLLLVLVLGASLVACNNEAKKEQKAATIQQEEMNNEILTVDQLENQIADLVGKTVTVEGDVDHVCKHGGTKMVILGDSADIHIKATDESGNFRADEVMDHRVVVNGIVDEFRVDEDFIAKKEAELEDLIANGGDKEAKEEGEEHEEKGMFPDNDTKHKKQVAGLKKQIESLKNMLAKAKEEGKDYLSFYSIKAHDYTIDKDAKVKSESKAFDDGAAEQADEKESESKEANGDK